MKLNRICSVLVVVVSGFGTAICAEQESKTVDPSGTWRWEYEMQGETIKDKLHLNLEKEGKVTGTLHGRLGAIEVKDGKIDGDAITFATVMSFQGNEFTLEFKGRIKEDSIEGNVSVDTPDGEREFPWSPKRSVELEDCVGLWQIRIESPDGNVYEPTMKIAKDGEQFKSVYTTMRGQELEAKKLRVEKNKLMFTVGADFDGNSMTVSYEGRPYGNKIKGMLDYDISGNAGEVEFTGKRKKEEKQATEK